MEDLSFRIATPGDAERAARLFVLEKDLPFQKAFDLFNREFSLPPMPISNRTYLLSYQGDQLLSFAGIRLYNHVTDENMYGTAKLLPSGWYLRGLKVHPGWRRRGLGREMTVRRLEMVREKTTECYVFLDNENKITVPMYIALGFKEVSKGWAFSEPQRIAKGTTGILLKKKI